MRAPKIDAEAMILALRQQRDRAADEAAEWQAIALTLQQEITLMRQKQTSDDPDTVGSAATP